MIILEFEPCGQTTKTRCFHWMVSSWSASLSNVVSFTRLCMMRSTYCWSFQATFNIFLGVFNERHSSFPSPTPFINTAKSTVTLLNTPSLFNILQIFQCQSTLLFVQCTVGRFTKDTFKTRPNSWAK